MLVNTNKLLEKIEKKREEMVQAAKKKGYTDKQVVNLSNQLDSLLNKITRKDKVSNFKKKR